MRPSLGRKIATLCLIFMLSSNLAATPTAPPASPADLASLLQELGFRPSGIPAPAFTLPALDGAQVSLEKYRGEWLCLVFWATWCGACVKEMPLLETLHIAHKEHGLNVVAIALDENPNPAVADFAKSRDLTFPILLDTKNEIAAAYEARSVPSLYLISPDQLIVGVARGPVDWEDSKKIQLMAKILEFKNHPELAAQMATHSAPELPPPTMAMHLPTGELTVDTPYQVDIELNWQGDAAQYSIKIPKITLPEGFSLGTPSSSSSSEHNGSPLRYHYPFTVKTPGTYLVGPVELAFSSSGAEGESFSRLPAQEVVFLDQPKKWPFILAPLAGIFIAMGSAGMIMRRRKRSAKATEKNAALTHQREKLAARYQEASRLKIAGHSREYATALLALAAPLLEGTEQQELVKLQQEVTYAGAALLPSQLKNFERQIEKFLAET